MKLSGRRRLGLAVLVLAGLMLFQVRSLNQKPLLTAGVGPDRDRPVATTDEQALEIAAAMDALSQLNYGDGHGNRIPNGDDVRAKVSARQRTRRWLYGGSGACGAIGLLLVVWPSRREAPIPPAPIA